MNTEGRQHKGLVRRRGSDSLWSTIVLMNLVKLYCIFQPVNAISIRKTNYELMAPGCVCLDSCEPTSGCEGPNPGCLREWQLLFTFEPSP